MKTVEQQLKDYFFQFKHDEETWADYYKMVEEAMEIAIEKGITADQEDKIFYIGFHVISKRF